MPIPRGSKTAGEERFFIAVYHGSKLNTAALVGVNVDPWLVDLVCRETTPVRVEEIPEFKRIIGEASHE